jgi:HAD superfamily hydrolase (TIGR01662 family)
MTSQPALRFPYVMFDLGSTLIYFDGDWPVMMSQSVRAATRYLRELGYSLDKEAFPTAYYALIEEFYRKRNDTFTEYTSEHVMREALRAHSYPEPPGEHLKMALKVMYGVSQKHWHVEADAAPMLETLRERGHRLGIVSNASDDADVQTLVDNANLRSHFDFILTSAVAGYRKPNPEIFRQALAFWGADPRKTVMVGDIVSADVVGANQLGISSVWITRRNDTPENRALAARVSPGAVIYALNELPDLLENWPEPGE